MLQVLIDSSDIYFFPRVRVHFPIPTSGVCGHFILLFMFPNIMPMRAFLFECRLVDIHKPMHERI